MSQSLRVVVIGGGAAGFFGAITCATAHPSAQVTLLEAAPEVLGKVRISGGGRCNVTHHCFDPAVLVQHYPRGGKALRGAFSRFQPKDTIAWYEMRGVRLKTEADGRMFPTTDDSATIVDCLLKEARQVGVRIQTRTPVQAVAQDETGFVLFSPRSPDPLRCDRLLLATGSSRQGYRIATALGHTVAPPVPSLFTFTIPDRALHELAGIAIDPVILKLTVPQAAPLTQTGPLLITHWGLSGPAVLKLSAWGARLLHDHQYRATVQVNWLPHLSLEQVQHQLKTTRSEVPKRAIANHCPFDFPKRLWRYWLAKANLDDTTPWANLPNKALNRLAETLSRDSFAVQGKGIFKEEFVTCGGVTLSEVDFKTMASRRCRGLFLAGEVLDIDGVTGGFNFQSAWTTGWLAGQAIGMA